MAVTLIWGVAASAAGKLEPRNWEINGVKREGLVYAPANPSTQPTPVVFVFHGHGGGMRQASNSMPFHEVWPEAIVVYLQGLPTVGRLTDPQGTKNGWQSGPGTEGNRDLQFFDAVLATLKEDYHVDLHRIYATGHSNGGGFTYLLWSQRPDVFAAYGPSAAAAGRKSGRLRPAPVIHVAGEKDELVKFAWQQEMMAILRRNNQCGEGQPAGKGLTLYPSPSGAPVMTYIHGGTHRYPSEAPAIIADFFKAHPKD